MSLVGLIANPSAGKDIRRLVAHGRVVPNQEKVNILQRVLLALEAVGVQHVAMMPDPSQLCRRAISESQVALQHSYVDIPVTAQESDSTAAAKRLAEMGADCIVTLGGDGTCRAVARGSGDVPLVAISTGTNNVFPAMVEGTTAGIAAGLVATGVIPRAIGCRVQKRIEVHVGGELADIALVDVAVSRENFIASRAIWELSTVDELFLACAEPASIGLSAIGAHLHPLLRTEPGALHLRLGPGGHEVLAAIAPGTMQRVAVSDWRLLAEGERTEIRYRHGTVALDGERQFAVLPEQRVEVVVNAHGPTVVDINGTLAEAAKRGVFVDFHPPTG